ncbi:hypothetical protein ABE504_23780 [Paenibacillus oryzisoli]|uniref:hypothetical protein n=1 Tax=Paenibacillus oryzisoli TaxID=1850517 RepID=UPI003D283C9D
MSNQINLNEYKELFKLFQEKGASYFDVFNLPQEFSLVNITRLEKKQIKLIKDIKKANEPLLAVTVALTGFLLGETIARLYNATWVTEADEIWDYYLEHTSPDGSQFKVFPLVRTIKFFEKHKTYGLTSYVHGVELMFRKGLSNL